MSLLLDALKKSEAQRRRGQLPDMQTSLHDRPTTVAAQQRGRRLMLVALPLVAVLGAAGWWLMAPRDDAGRSAPAVAGAPVDGPAAPASGDAPAGPDRQLAPPPATAPAALPEPAPPSLAAQAERGSEPGAGGATLERAAALPPELQQQAAETRAPQVEAASQVEAAPSSPPAGQAAPPALQVAAPAAEQTDGPEAAEPVAEPMENFIRPWELPQQLRGEFPALKMSVHFYADDPAQRFVLINAERRAEGDEVANGVRLVEIVERGAVVEFRGYRILLQ